MKRTNFYFCRSDTIREIQTCFSHFYPSLEINFFLNKDNNQSDNAWVMLSPEVKIRTISPDCRNGCVELNNEMTIAEMENSVNDHFKVHSEISPIIGIRNVIPGHGTFSELRAGIIDSIRRPERTNAGYIKNMPFVC